MQPLFGSKSPSKLGAPSLAKKIFAGCGIVEVSVSRQIKGAKRQKKPGANLRPTFEIQKLTETLLQ